MWLVGASEYTEGSPVIFALAHKLVEDFEVGIISLTRIFKQESLRWTKIFISTKNQTV